MERNPGVSEGVICYHGTFWGCALRIMREGFRLGELTFGRALGQGLYVSSDVRTASFFSGDAVIVCRLERGTRILWLDKKYDRRVVRRLVREFGKGILQSPVAFHKAIPRNKQLTREELITLASYYFTTRARIVPSGARRVRAENSGWCGLSFPQLAEQLRRHQFDGLGNPRSIYEIDELLILNPSRVQPLSVHRACGDVHTQAQKNVWLSEPLTLDEVSRLAGEEDVSP